MWGHLQPSSYRLLVLAYTGFGVRLPSSAFGCGSFKSNYKNSKELRKKKSKIIRRFSLLRHVVGGSMWVFLKRLSPCFKRIYIVIVWSIHPKLIRLIYSNGAEQRFQEKRHFSRPAVSVEIVDKGVVISFWWMSP